MSREQELEKALRQACERLQVHCQRNGWTDYEADLLKRARALVDPPPAAEANIPRHSPLPQVFDPFSGARPPCVKFEGECSADCEFGLGTGECARSSHGRRP